MTRLRHMVRIGPSASEIRGLGPDDEVTFAPMDALADGLGGLDVSLTRPLGELIGGSYNYFAEGDVLLAKVTPCFENGKKAIAGGLANGVGFATSEVHVVRPDPSRLDAGFLRYLFSAEDFRAAGMRTMAGSGGLRRVNERAVLEHRPKVIDLGAQKAIADFLDDETTRIDALVAKKAQFAVLAGERWRSKLDTTIFGGAAGERPMDLEGKPRLPDGWLPTPLKHLTDDRRQIMYGIVLPGPNVEDGVLIVKGGDVKPGRLHPDRLCKTTAEIEAGYARSRLKGGDLVIAIRGGIGDVEIVPDDIDGANLTQDAARVAPRNGVHNEWLRFALLAPSVFAPLEAKTTGAAVRGINIFDLKRVMVPMPPTSAQIAIADDLRAASAKIERLRALVDTHAATLREFRSALITAAVTGRIDPADWRRRGEVDRRLARINEEMSG